MRYHANMYSQPLYSILGHVQQWVGGYQFEVIECTIHARHCQLLVLHITQSMGYPLHSGTSWSLVSITLSEASYFVGSL